MIGIEATINTRKDVHSWWRCLGLLDEQEGGSAVERPQDISASGIYCHDASIQQRDDEEILLPAVDDEGFRHIKCFDECNPLEVSLASPCSLDRAKLPTRSPHGSVLCRRGTQAQSP